MPSRPANRRYDLAAILLIGAVVAMLWLRLAPVVDEAGFLGWDAYPILLASQVETASDVWDVATRRLAGEHLKASFYRPLFMLSVSAEQALLDATPKTSLAIQVILFGLSLTALWWWMRSWSDVVSSARPTGLIAMCFVSMHPSVFDVVPYLPRRAGLLCLFLVLLTLCFDRAWTQSGRRVDLVAALACASLAMASKESAILLPILVVASRWLGVSDLVAFLRDRRWLAPLVAYGAAVGWVLLPRLAILGGAGGYPDSGRDLPFSPKLVLVTLIQLVAPDSGLVGQKLGGVVVLVLLGVGGFLALWPPKEGLLRHRPAVFSCLWVLLAALLFAVVGRVSPWYVLFVTFAAAPGVSHLTVEAWRGLSSPRDGPGWTWRHWGMGWLAGLALLLAVWWPGSLLGGSTSELRDAGQAVGACVEDMARRCDEATPGVEVSVPSCRATVVGHGRNVAGTKPRSMAAWAQLHRPDCQTQWETNP